MEHALLSHDSVNCTHCNEFSHFIVNTEDQIVLLASRFGEVYTGSVNYFDFTCISWLRLDYLSTSMFYMLVNFNCKI